MNVKAKICIDSTMSEDYEKRTTPPPTHTHKHQQVIKFIRPNIITIRSLVLLKVQIHFSLKENKSLHSSEPEMVSDCACCFVL